MSSHIPREWGSSNPELGTGRARGIAETCSEGRKEGDALKCHTLEVAEKELKVVQRKATQKKLLRWTAELKSTLGRESP